MDAHNIADGVVGNEIVLQQGHIAQGAQSSPMPLCTINHQMKQELQSLMIGASLSSEQQVQSSQPQAAGKLAESATRHTEAGESTTHGTYLPNKIYFSHVVRCRRIC
jgi:hypothetical protein